MSFSKDFQGDLFAYPLSLNNAHHKSTQGLN